MATLTATLHTTLAGYGSSSEEEQDKGVGTSKSGGLKPAQQSTALVETQLANALKWQQARVSAATEKVTFQPCNVKKQASTNGVKANGAGSLPSPASSTASKQAGPSSPPPPLPTLSTSNAWPSGSKVGAGLSNDGNTCYLNSTLQVLLHTPQLVRFVAEGSHDSSTCQLRKERKPCMTCILAILVNKSQAKTRPYFRPGQINDNLRAIAPTLRVGRQEDAHEFLRFCIDGMQNSVLHGIPQKQQNALKDSTFVHQIFGGRLRSRVHCTACGHDSDTFDTLLDLSLDIQNVDSVRSALAKFIQVDVLRGSNKYKCEKCKKLVEAHKQFTIMDAPQVLSVHLKRFTSTGRKINDHVKYSDKLNLGPYMSERSNGPTYSLYGIVNHSGGGPHSGHYTAHVRAPNGTWHSMNDSSVSSVGMQAPIQRNAYMLFYLRDQGDRMMDAISTPIVPRPSPFANGSSSNGSGQKRKEPPSSPEQQQPKKTYYGPERPPVDEPKFIPQVVVTSRPASSLSNSSGYRSIAPAPQSKPYSSSFPSAVAAPAASFYGGGGSTNGLYGGVGNGSNSNGGWKQNNGGMYGRGGGHHHHGRGGGGGRGGGRGGRGGHGHGQGHGGGYRGDRVRGMKPRTLN